MTTTMRKQSPSKNGKETSESSSSSLKSIKDILTRLYGLDAKIFIENNTL